MALIKILIELSLAGRDLPCKITLDQQFKLLRDCDGVLNFREFLIATHETVSSSWNIKLKQEYNNSKKGLCLL